MVDHLPVADVPAGDEQLPLPRRHTLALLVGRVTTIKLAFWAAVTAFELALPRIVDRPLAERFAWSIAFAAAASALALLWAARSARAVDRGAGRIPRSIATVATTFAAASVVASPASIPLLLIELQRSFEGCAGAGACHLEAVVLWVALFAVGFVLVPAAFAASLQGDHAG